MPGRSADHEGRGVPEVYMGHYMREWLTAGLVTRGECPPENTVYAYANGLSGTVHQRRLPANRSSSPTNGHHGPDV